jgi:hypothetical protein
MRRFIPPKLILFLSSHFILHYTHPLQHNWQLIAYLYHLSFTSSIPCSVVFSLYIALRFGARICVSTRNTWRNNIT